VKAGITTVCVHKGLLPPDYEKSFADVWKFATADDVGKAAKDWPQINFVIYHSALRPFLELPDQAWAEFEASGRIKWASDLADIPAKYGVTNVYADLGTSFANSAVAHPKFCAAFVGTLVKGLGADHVVWGTDAVWYGSPQWQIEAMRRLEIPEDMQKKYGFAPLGDANGATKQAIFGLNTARLYRLNLKAADAAPMPPYSADRLAEVCDAINATGYGLTLGIHSRIDETAKFIRDRVQVGNVYVNRNQIGAVVGVQPFGGEGLSGTGPKAGGPHYLFRFATERTFTVNTAAAGGNATLIASSG